MALETVVAKVGGGAAGRQNQIVIWLLVLLAAAVDVEQTAVCVHRHHLSQQKLHVSLAAKDVAYWVCNFAGIKGTGGNLVKQRGKGVVVIAVYQQHLNWLVCQGAGGKQPAKTRAHNDNSWFCWFRHDFLP